MSREQRLEAALRNAHAFIWNVVPVPGSLLSDKKRATLQAIAAALGDQEAAEVLALAYDESIEVEWQRVRQERPDLAVRWALVRIFGTEHRYHYDAEFHARIRLAERMVQLAAAPQVAPEPERPDAYPGWVLLAKRQTDRDHFILLCTAAAQGGTADDYGAAWDEAHAAPQGEGNTDGLG